MGSDNVFLMRAIFYVFGQSDGIHICPQADYLFPVPGFESRHYTGATDTGTDFQTQLFQLFRYNAGGAYLLKSCLGVGVQIPAESSEFFLQYFSAMEKPWEEASQALYLQGMRDCAALLREMGILGE